MSIGELEVITCQINEKKPRIHEWKLTEKKRNKQDQHETSLRSLSRFLEPGPNCSWKSINCSISASIFFMVSVDSGSSKSDACPIFGVLSTRGSATGRTTAFSCAGDSVILSPSSTMSMSPSSTCFSCKLPSTVCMSSLRAFSNASLRLDLSRAVACSLATQSTSALTLLFISPTLIRLLGHLTFTPRSIVTSNISPLLDVPAPKPGPVRTSRARGVSDGSICCKCDR